VPAEPVGGAVERAGRFRPRLPKLAVADGDRVADQGGEKLLTAPATLAPDDVLTGPAAPLAVCRS